MYSEFDPEFNGDAKYKAVQDNLRRCVHCGFCNATCPTYQLTGDELDGPRGRIYLIKQLVEGGQVSQKTQRHLDRCLTCRSCESTCPSGVAYGRLADIGRQITEQRVGRSLLQRLFRRLLLGCLPYPNRLTPFIRLSQKLRPLLPVVLKNKIPVRQPEMQWPEARHRRQVLLLEGCVQKSLAPQINVSAVRVLDKLGVSVIRLTQANCCGALNYHLNDHQGGLAFMRAIIDACWPSIEQGIEAVTMTASGCVAMLKDYGVLLQGDPVYAAKADRFAAMVKDLSELITGLEIAQLQVKPGLIAFHSPCTLQHGQQLNGIVENLLIRLGFNLTPVQDPHICCGSAGTYSIFQPRLAGQLRSRKLSNLTAGQPELIATANIGCLLYLQEKADIPVVHWIELL